MVLPKFNIGKSKIILNILLVNFFGLDGKNHLRGRNEKKVQLSSEFPPAEITDLCAPASTDYNKREAAKDGIDTRVSNN